MTNKAVALCDQRTGQDGGFVKLKNCFRMSLPAWVFLTAFIVFDLTLVKADGIQLGPPSLTLRDGQEEYLLGRSIEYLEDPSQMLGIEQVSSQEYADKFTGGDADILNFGLKDSSYWLRITAENKTAHERRWFLELARPSMNSVFFYKPSADGSGFTEIKTGYVYPFSTRDVAHENFVFKLDLPTKVEQTYYLRVKDMSLDLPLRIWSEHAFSLHDQISRTIIALSFGALFTMLLYNIILLFIMRDLGHVYYALFQTFLLLYLGSVQGYAPRYLWPNATYLNVFVIPLFIALGGLFQTLFSWDFLRFASHPKWVDYIRNILVGLFAVSIPPAFVIGAKTLTVILPLILAVNIYAFFFGVWASWRRYKPARYYLFAWSIFLIIGLGATLHHMGWITVKQIIPEQALHLGAVYLVIFQSFALADRINFYKQEHLNAQARLILQQSETLSLKDRLNSTLENARTDLENRVAQRTLELIELNSQLSAEIIERKNAEDELKRLASIDFLTGLFNRRHFFEIARNEFDRSVRYGTPISVLIFDIDYFKSVNDCYGHLVGDQALAHIGKLIRETTRSPADIPARYGGEEFVILMPETNCENAAVFAERLRKLVEQSPIPHEDHPFFLTLSIGVSGKSNNSHAGSFDQLISQADQSLYKAKSTGRNKVVCNCGHMS
jgi:diguanylate cyclase (GGDEF)-like protein